MKKAFLSIVMCAALAAIPAVALAAESGATAAIKRLSSEFVAAWNAHDAKKMAATWTENGDLINPFGQKASGRAAIEKFFANEQAGVMKGTTYKIESISIRELDPSCAVGDWESVVTGMMDPNGRPLPPFQHHVSVVYVKRGGHWLAAAVRAFVPQPVPAAAAK